MDACKVIRPGDRGSRSEILQDMGDPSIWPGVTINTLRAEFTDGRCDRGTEMAIRKSAPRLSCGMID